MNRGEENALKTNCPQGHPYDEGNTARTSQGWRRCRVCDAGRKRNGPRATITQEVIDRYWLKVDKRSPDECWPWLGYVAPSGYGRFHIGSQTVLTHRVSYEIQAGPIPKGETLDHLCCNRWCQNARHMEPVTNVENVMRGNGFGALNTAKTHCPHGHLYDAENTYRTPTEGYRKCRTCQRAK